jgi:hypothetical protein
VGTYTTCGAGGVGPNRLIGLRHACRARWIAVLSLSDPLPVKITSLDVEPASFAACARALITAARQGALKQLLDDGLPKHWEVKGSMAAVTSGKMGVVAFQSRYLCVRGGGARVRVRACE